MDGIKLMLVLVVALGVERTYSQGPSNFRVLTGSEARELELGQNPELQEFLAGIGERVIINITGGESTAILQEGVNALIDCFPFLSRFPGGQISWFFRRIDQFGNSVTADSALPLPPPVQTVRRRVEGEFNRYLNITRTSIVSAAEDPDSAIYTCQVCVAQGTRFEECRNASTRVYLLGSPPDVICGEPNAGPVVVRPTGSEYRIGTNFCLDFEGPRQRTSATLDCQIVQQSIEDNIPGAFPTPDRTWDKDGIILYSVVSEEDPNPELEMDFFMENPYLMRGLVEPSGFPLTILSTGSLRFNHRFTNISSMGVYPADITVRDAQRLAFNNILGTWTCSANNSLGGESCSSTIRECGPPPVLPGCSGPLFPDEDATVFVGCPVCIREGTRVTLDCAVMSGQTPEISYQWDRDDMEVSTERTLTVNTEGNYTCEVTNLDGMDNQTTMVFFSPRYAFSTSIATLQDDTLTTATGCGRLRNSSAIPGVDRCVLVGETITFECQGFGGEADVNISIVDPMGTEQPSPYTVMVTLDNAADIGGNYTCQVEATGLCGGTRGVLGVVVYDPARIDRVVSLPDATEANLPIGVGRFEQAVVVQQGQAATLYCPTSGIDEPQETWREVVFDARGQASEQVVTPTRNEIRDGVETLVLEIPNFNVSSPRTYVCRTDNIAGSDAGVITLVGPDGSVWVTGAYSACEPFDCNLGTQTRSVVCRSTRDNRVLPDSECLQNASRPATTLQCTGPCFLNPTWRAFPWAPCSKGCGGGYRKREVVCHVPRTGVVLPDSECLETRPRRFEFCPNTCCVKDDYPSVCSFAGTASCGMNSFQQACCWTCQQRDGPH